MPRGWNVVGASVKIRSFEKRDLTDIRALGFGGVERSRLLELFTFFFEKYWIRIKWVLKEHSIEALFSGRVDKNVFVAEASGKVVGYATVHYMGRRLWRLDLLTVHSRWRRQDIGSNLVNTAKSYAKQRNGKSIVLLVRTDNEAAIRVYKRLGFQYSGYEMKCQLE